MRNEERRQKKNFSWRLFIYSALDPSTEFTLSLSKGLDDTNAIYPNCPGSTSESSGTNNKIPQKSDNKIKMGLLCKKSIIDS